MLVEIEWEEKRQEGKGVSEKRREESQYSPISRNGAAQSAVISSSRPTPKRGIQFFMWKISWLHQITSDFLLNIFQATHSNVKNNTENKPISNFIYFFDQHNMKFTIKRKSRKTISLSWQVYRKIWRVIDLMIIWFEMKETKWGEISSEHPWRGFDHWIGSRND